MKYLRHFFLILLGNVFISILAQGILGKYGKIHTSNGYIIFDSSSFSNGDKMYFTLSSNDLCYYYLDRIRYIYISSPTDLSPSPTTNYIVYKDAQSTSSVNGYITSVKSYFTIKKKESEFGSTNGEYLYMEFDCNNVAIENTKESGAKKVAIIAIIVTVIFVVIFVVLIIICCYLRRKRRLARAAMMINGPGMVPGYGVSPYGATPYYGQQQIYPSGNVVYASQTRNLANMNFAAPQTVQVAQNGVMQPSGTNRGIIHNYEKPRY